MNVFAEMLDINYCRAAQQMTETPTMR